MGTVALHRDQLFPLNDRSCTHLPSTGIIAFNSPPSMIWTAVNACDLIVGEIGFLVEVLECVKSEDVKVPQICILLQITDFESERDRS